ncbi:MAG: flagellar basal body-associated FliL family protein [Oligoflexia bacterium]|nr:flagellar basal body-associated FliL family protein [Oligoflexia bacterium]
MADEKKDAKQDDAKKDKKDGAEAAQAEAAPAKSGSKKAIFIGLGVVVLLIAIGVPVAFFALRKPATDEKGLPADLASGEEGKLVAEGSHDEDELEEGEEALGAIFPMETLVVNLSGGRYIRLQIQLEFTERDVPKRFFARLVPVRDALIEMLGRRSADDLLGDKGKEELKKSIRESINELMKREEIKRVYFTQFVIQ